MDPEPPALLRAVDRAALAAAFGDRLRHAGGSVPSTALAELCQALGMVPPERLDELYWTMRLTLVRHRADLEPFDRVFDAAFRDVETGADPNARRRRLPGASQEPQGRLVSVPGDRRGGVGEEGGLPWHTLPAVTAEEGDLEERSVLPELLPSSLVAMSGTAFEEFDEEQLAALGRWLERASPSWPVRRGRRSREGPGGKVALRQTISASRRAGGEPLLALRRQRPVDRPRSLTLVTDVSASMQSYATAYLHLMRAFARTGRAETFAFSTSLTRVTPALVHRSAASALALAEARVVDRYGGTHLARALRGLLDSRHGTRLRGGVLIVASDGWDSDPPDELAEVMARLARRTHRVVWLNPRAGADGFAPLVGSMQAALPWCDEFLPAHTMAALPDVFDAVARGGRAGSRASLSSRG